MEILQPITIGTYTNPTLIINRLNNELKTLQREGYFFDIDIDKVGEFTFMDCIFHHEKLSNEESFNTIKLSIANCLADIIIEEWESLLIRKIVMENFYYYNDEEKQAILNKAKNILNPAGLKSFNQNLRKEKVMQRISEYLDLHKNLIVEGFINFRLKDYQNELEVIVNSAVDELLMEKEYQEFIRLLKYFVDIQEPRIHKVQIVFKNNGKFSLLNENDQPIKHDCLEGLMIDLLENEINYDDLLISALITLAPRELVLHMEPKVEDTETINTIIKVFGNRVVKCTGCPKCR